MSYEMESNHEMRWGNMGGRENERYVKQREKLTNEGQQTL